MPAFVGRSSAEILNRLSDLPGQVADRVVNAWREAQAAVADQPDSDVTVAGWPLEEVTDPFVLEVHRPVQPEDAPAGLPGLPPYVPREHDDVLGQVVRAAADGRSGIAVLVGGSSTGKTRACWEVLQVLRDQDPPWRLWHPIDPSRPDAALAELPGIGPRTVVWLNEAQFYLDTAEAGLGERVAAGLRGLRGLLRDPVRAPVLVLATMWPQYWHDLTARPAGGADPHAQARELLAGHDITVPAAFTPAQISLLTQAADARIALAARSAADGQVIQFVAGAPELLARYRNAPPAAEPGHLARAIHAHVREERRDAGAGSAACQLGELEVGLDPQQRAPPCCVSPGRVGDVEIAASHAPHLAVDGEYPAEGRQNSRLAGPVGTEQVRHRLEVNGRWLGPEALEVLQAHPGEAHDSPAIIFDWVMRRFGERRAAFIKTHRSGRDGDTTALWQSKHPRLENKDRSADASRRILANTT